MKKGIVIFCAAVVMLVIIALIPKGVDEITHAVVNPNNGDIAFCYHDHSHAAHPLRIVAYDKFGEELFSKSFYTSRGASMTYSGDELCVSIWADNEKYSYDRQGNGTESDISIAEIEKNSGFSEWEISFGKKRYTLGEYIYCYDAPTVFKHRARLTISDGENTKTIYESP